MLDDFREQANASPFYEEEEPPSFDELPVERKRLLLGMTAAQRFVVALMFLLIVCLIGAFALLVTERIVLPFI
jgi:hypothetical protein